MKLGKKVRFAASVNCLIRVGADGSRAANDLLGNDALMFFLRKIPMQLDDPGGKMKGFIYHKAARSASNRQSNIGRTWRWRRKTESVRIFDGKSGDGTLIGKK